MKKELITELFERFEDACYDLGGLECWSGRELQEILGYSDWRNFTNTIQKAVKSCENSGEKESDHFVGVTKLIEIGKGGPSKNTSASAVLNPVSSAYPQLIPVRNKTHGASLFQRSLRC